MGCEGAGWKVDRQSEGNRLVEVKVAGTQRNGKRPKESGQMLPLIEMFAHIALDKVKKQGCY